MSQCHFVWEFWRKVGRLFFIKLQLAIITIFYFWKHIMVPTWFNLKLYGEEERVRLLRKTFLVYTVELIIYLYVFVLKLSYSSHDLAKYMENNIRFVWKNQSNSTLCVFDKIMDKIVPHCCLSSAQLFFQKVSEYVICPQTIDTQYHRI